MTFIGVKEKQRRSTVRGLSTITLCIALTSGCMTLDTRTNPSYDGPPAYSGTRLALGNFRDAFLAVRPEFMAFFLVDSVLSGVADTLLLPITIGEQSRWSAARERAARTDLEQPSVIRPAKGEDPIRSANRLYRTCNNLLRNLRDRYTDCYTIEADIQIVVEGELVRTPAAIEYKNEIREALAPKRGTAEYVRWADESFEQEGDNVRVKATRVDSAYNDKTPIELLMGPGPDGEWRILEEKSVGWR